MNWCLVAASGLVLLFWFVVIYVSMG